MYKFATPSLRAGCTPRHGEDTAPQGGRGHAMWNSPARCAGTWTTLFIKTNLPYEQRLQDGRTTGDYLRPLHTRTDRAVPGVRRGGANLLAAGRVGAVFCGVGHSLSALPLRPLSATPLPHPFALGGHHAHAAPYGRRRGRFPIHYRASHDGGMLAPEGRGAALRAARHAARAGHSRTRAALFPPARQRVPA